MSLCEDLVRKYNDYEAQGHAVFTVTLSTYVKSEAFARRHMSSFWNQHFIHRVRRRLPYKLKDKFDHDFIVECSPGGCYHYHGLMAFTSDAGKRIWRDGKLDAQLTRDLDSFQQAGDYRLFCVKKHLVEPMRQGGSDWWCKYITKSSDIPMSSVH